MKDELKPCPFCGRKLEDYKIQNYAYCICGAAVKIALKNNRPIEDELKAKIAVLKESEADLIERLNEQRRYTEQSVKEVDRLYERISELESHVQDSVP